MKGQKFGNPRGKSCRWTPELDEILKSAWAHGGLRAARRAIRQQQPTWSPYSIKKRAAILELCRPKARPWSETDVDHLLWSIDSNASMAFDCATARPDCRSGSEEAAGARVHRRKSRRVQG